MALHRIQDFIEAAPIGAPDHEVVHAIGRGAMDDAGARIHADVFGQVDRRYAIVERMMEFDARETHPFCRCNHRALQSVARQTTLGEFGSEQKL